VPVRMGNLMQITEALMTQPPWSALLRALSRAQPTGSGWFLWSCWCLVMRGNLHKPLEGCEGKPTPLQEYTSKIRIHMCILLFYEERRKHIHSGEIFGLPNELECIVYMV